MDGTRRGELCLGRRGLEMRFTSGTRSWAGRSSRATSSGLGGPEFVLSRADRMTGVVAGIEGALRGTPDTVWQELRVV